MPSLTCISTSPLNVSLKKSSDMRTFGCATLTERRRAVRSCPLYATRHWHHSDAHIADAKCAEKRQDNRIMEISMHARATVPILIRQVWYHMDNKRSLRRDLISRRKNLLNTLLCSKRYHSLMPLAMGDIGVSNDQQFDSTDDLEARRQRLKALRERIRSGPGRQTAASGPANEEAGAASGLIPRGLNATGPVPGGFGGDPSRQLATFLLRTLRMREDENTPTIPGTAFTEQGVQQMLEALKSRSESLGAGGRGLSKRLYAYLTRPAKDGEEMVAGVNKDSLTRFVNFLTQMQSTGLEGVTKQLQSGKGPGRDLLEGFAGNRMEQLESHIKSLEATIENLKQQIADLTANDREPTPSAKKTRSHTKGAGGSKNAVAKATGKAKA